MSFFSIFALVAVLISLGGILFIYLGFREMARLRTSMPWSAILRTAIRGTGNPARSGLFECVIGAFLVLIPMCGLGSLSLVQLALPKRVAFNEELRRRTGYEAPLAWYASGHEDFSPALNERFVDFAFSYPADWRLEVNAGNELPLFVRVRRTEPDSLFSQESFSVAPTPWRLGKALRDQPPADAMAELSSQIAREFPNSEQEATQEYRIGIYEGFGFDFAGAIDEEGRQVHYRGRAILLSPVETGQENGLAVIFSVADGPPGDAGKDLLDRGALPVLAKSFRLGLEHRHQPIIERPSVAEID